MTHFVWTILLISMSSCQSTQTRSELQNQRYRDMDNNVEHEFAGDRAKKNICVRQCRPISIGKCQRTSEGPIDLVLTESDFIKAWIGTHFIGPNPPNSYSEILEYQKVLDADIAALDPTDPRHGTKKLYRIRTDELLAALDKVYDNVLRTDRDWDSVKDFVATVTDPEKADELFSSIRMA